MIDQCVEFHNKVIQMLTQGTLRIEEATSKEILVIDEPNKNTEVCRV
jgi:hypothetical protein